MLKTKPGRFHCDPKDLQYIQQTFLKGRMPTIHEMKILGGKMNIKFYFDKQYGKWVIEKQ